MQGTPVKGTPVIQSVGREPHGRGWPGGPTLVLSAKQNTGRLGPRGAGGPFGPTEVYGNYVPYTSSMSAISRSAIHRARSNGMYDVRRISSAASRSSCV